MLHTPTRLPSPTSQRTTSQSTAATQPTARKVHLRLSQRPPKSRGKRTRPPIDRQLRSAHTTANAQSTARVSRHSTNNSRPSTSVHSQLSEQPSVVDGTTRPAPRATNDRVHCTSQSTVPASEPAVDCTRQSTPHTNDRSRLHESVDQHHNQRQESTARDSRLTHDNLPRQQSTVARKHSRPSQSREQSTAAHPQQPTDDTITQSTVRESLTVPSTQSTLTTAARH